MGKDIPAGPFLYGEDKQPRELPTFFIARYPVTDEQYDAFFNDGGYAEKHWWEGIGSRIRKPRSAVLGQPSRPRGYVSWYEAMAFCRWLSKQLGYQVRLPSEPEWEKAARGEDGCVLPWKDDYHAGYANLNERSGEAGVTYLKQTIAVGLYPHAASPYGVDDLIGNVLEWCLNEFVQPDGAEQAHRAERGTSHMRRPNDAQASRRISCSPLHDSNTLDFAWCVRPRCHADHKLVER